MELSLVNGPEITEHSTVPPFAKNVLLNSIFLFLPFRSENFLVTFLKFDLAFQILELTFAAFEFFPFVDQQLLLLT